MIFFSTCCLDPQLCSVMQGLHHTVTGRPAYSSNSARFMGSDSFHGDAEHLELWVPGWFLHNFLSHGHQLCLIQNCFVEGVFVVHIACQSFVKRNDDVWDVVGNHGLGHTDRSPIPPALLPVPSAVLEIVCSCALGCFAPFCVCQLKAIDRRDEVNQGFSGVNALFTSRPKTGPKHRCFAIIEHGAGEVVVLPCVLGRMLDGVLRLCAAPLLIVPTAEPLTSLCKSLLQRAKLLVTFVLRAVWLKAKNRQNKYKNTTLKSLKSELWNGLCLRGGFVVHSLSLPELIIY